MNNNLRVVALDPGRTTGYAHGIIDLTEGKMLVVTGQDKFDYQGMRDHLEQTDPQIVIYERFDYRNRARKGLDMYPRELIGIIELYCSDHGLVNLGRVYPQMPSAVMQHFTDGKLKSDNLYKIGKPHANDAARHILYWFTFGPGFKYNEKGYELGV